MAFLLVSVILFNGIAFFMPKRLGRADMFVIALFGLVFQQLVDMFVNLKYDLYGFFQTGVDWLSLIPMLGLFPSVTLIFFNFYPWNNMKSSVLYVGLASAFLVGFEYLSLLAGYFYYHGWKLWWSVFEYPLLLYINVAFYKVFKILTKPADGGS
ncbi:CBO0543 family protein [Paenibacillus hamazuiensis]|uniref:CBO0543 family protein n=1 Tax=Paenibacillus hamazuiensis TaxID=2936508 RepID=UPI00200E2820|nr:CBO0543 family protein [Paenibacillus hamazuiensis]